MPGKWKTTSSPGKLAEIKRQIKDMENIEARVGWFDSTRYPDGTPVAGIAVVQEFGTEDLTIPPRSFMRTTQAERKPEWDKVMSQGFTKIMKGKMTSEQLITLIAVMARGDVDKKISLIFAPPLQTSTIKARARRAGKKPKIISIKPLHDTGYLQATLAQMVIRR